MGKKRRKNRTNKGWAYNVPNEMSGTPPYRLAIVIMRGNKYLWFQGHGLYGDDFQNGCYISWNIWRQDAKNIPLPIGYRWNPLCMYKLSDTIHVEFCVPLSCYHLKKRRLKYAGKTWGVKFDFKLDGVPQRIHVMEVAYKNKKIANTKHYTPAPKPQPPRVVKKELERCEITARHFLTRINSYSCIYADHKLTDVICVVPIVNLDGEIIYKDIAGVYCETCDRYYILKKDFLKLKMLGRVACRVVETDYWTQEPDTTNYGWQTESTLHMMGYNVNAQVNLSTKQRWTLLEWIIDKNILTRYEIASHLNWLINLRQNNPSMEAAITKWEVDREHIMNYEKGSLTKYLAESIEVKNHHYK